MLGASFAASLPQVNIAATAKQSQIKVTENTITYHYDGDTPLQLSGYSNSIAQYNEGLSSLQYSAQHEIVSDDHGNSLRYDALGEMVGFENSKSHDQVNYTYDIESHQGAESVVNAAGKTIVSQVFYYSTGNKAQMIGESDSDGEQLSYLFAENKIGSINNTDQASLYITDQAGSVIALASNSGITHQYLYSPYGIMTDMDQSTTKAKNAQGFDGQRTDKATGYQFLGNGYRAYNPILHRFMQMDDIRYSPFGKDGINGYVFGNNNPIMNFDPTGHNAWEIFNYIANGFAGIDAQITGSKAWMITSSVLAGASLIDVFTVSALTAYASYKASNVDDAIFRELMEENKSFLNSKEYQNYRVNKKFDIKTNFKGREIPVEKPIEKIRDPYMDYKKDIPLSVISEETPRSTYNTEDFNEIYFSIYYRMNDRISSATNSEDVSFGEERITNFSYEDIADENGSFLASARINSCYMNNLENKGLINYIYFK